MTVPVLGSVPPAPEVRIRYSSVADGVDPGSLFGVARRINPRRSALFVSKVLGKHVPLDPAHCMAWGRRLGEWHGPCHVVGFAETATALGHLVYDALPGGSDYVHSTRIVEPGWPAALQFSEDHSHATAHRVVHRDPGWLADGRPVLFVDDELTTGRTILNLVAAIEARWPRDEYRVATFLDWRDAAARAAFDRAGVAVASLVAGEATWDDTPMPAVEEVHPGAFDVPVVHHEVDLGPATARHGWDVTDQAALEERIPEVAGKLTAARTGPRALVLGTEEFMYAPLRVAAAMGDGVLYQSTTRSPIVAADVEGYPIRHKATFADRFVYNVAPGAYDDVFVLFEEPPADPGPLVRALSAARPGTVHLVVCR